MKRVLLDQGLAPRAATLLRADGWDAIHVIETGLDSAQDADILDFALRENRVCVTLDHDFHVHLALAKSVAPSVVFVRAEGLGAQDQFELIKMVWLRCAGALESGAAVSVDRSKIRIKKLPLK